MELVITGLHIGICFFLILVVLLQPGKGADFGAAMGGASQEVFGAGGGISLLSKITAGVAATFMMTSLYLAKVSSDPSTEGGDILGLEALGDKADASEEVPLPTEETAPEQPAVEGIEPATEPAADPADEPAADPADEPAADPADEPAVEGSTEQTNQ
jgi:preprotein translocase subunit SecG